MQTISREDLQIILNNPSLIDGLTRNVRLVLNAIDTYRQEMNSGDDQARFRPPISDDEFARTVLHYESLCVAINARLTSSMMLISAGNPREAIRQAEVSPRLLDLFAQADLSDDERLDWSDYLKECDLPIPTLIHRDKAESLADAIGKQTPELERFSAELRILMLARAPLSERISTLRNLVKLDSRFHSDLDDWEKVRLEQIDREVDDAYRLRTTDPNLAFNQIVGLVNELSAEGWIQPQEDRKELNKKIDRRLVAIQQLLHADVSKPKPDAPPPPPREARTPQIRVETERETPEVNAQRLDDDFMTGPVPQSEIDAAPVPTPVVTLSPDSTTFLDQKLHASRLSSPLEPPTPPAIRPKEIIRRNATMIALVGASGFLAMMAGLGVYIFVLMPQWKEQKMQELAKKEWSSRLDEYKQSIGVLEQSLNDFNKLSLDPKSPIPSGSRVVDSHNRVREYERIARNLITTSDWGKSIPAWEKDIGDLALKHNELLETLEVKLNGFLNNIERILTTQRDPIAKGILDEPDHVLRSNQKRLDDLKELAEILPAVRDRTIQLFKLRDDLSEQISDEREKTKILRELDKISASILEIQVLDRYVQQLQDYITNFTDKRAVQFEEVLKDRSLWKQAIENRKYHAIGWLDLKDESWICRSKWNYPKLMDIKLVTAAPSGGLNWVTIGTMSNGKSTLETKLSGSFKQGRLVFVSLGTP